MRRKSHPVAPSHQAAAVARCASRQAEKRPVIAINDRPEPTFSTSKSTFDAVAKPAIPWVQNDHASVNEPSTT
jgi:hypothetical protein